MRVYDVFDEVLTSGAADQMILEEITDYADQVNRARVGYVFSTAQQQKSILLANANDDKFIALGGAGTGSIMYVNLLWRPFPGSLPTFADDQGSDSDSEIEVISQKKGYLHPRYRRLDGGFSPSPSTGSSRL
jgi:hypothetical protein